MGHKLFLNFPLGDSDDMKCAKTLREDSRNRIRSAVLITDHGVDTSDVGSLMRDAEELSVAAQRLDDGDPCELHEDMPDGGFEKLHEHARAVRCAIDGLLGTALERETTTALSELAFGLERSLAAAAERGHVDGLDPLSPAALEKTIGIDGLRRLREAIADNFDAVINHIEYYVETREGVPFKPSYCEDGSFEDLRSTREKIDPTKPLGYYEEDGEPVASAGGDEAEGSTTADEDAGMLLDSIVAAVPNGDELHRLRVAAFDRHDELTQVLTEFMDSPSQPAE